MQGNFPRLRGIRSDESEQVVSILETLPSRQHVLLTSGLVKRFQPDVAREIAPITQYEQEACLQFDAERMRFVPRRDAVMARSGDVRKAVLEALGALGEFQRVNAGEFLTMSLREDTSVTLRLDFGGRKRQVGYRQTVQSPRGVISQTSVMHYLGLSMQTDMKSIARSESRTAAEHLKALCIDFQEAAFRGFGEV